MASRVSRSNGMPSVKILISSTNLLPNIIQLPKPGGGSIIQKVEYVGLPNQCFTCKRMGHLAKNCPDSLKGEKSQENGPRVRDQWKSVHCFTCKQTGHFARMCPSTQKGGVRDLPSTSAPSQTNEQWQHD